MKIRSVTVVAVLCAFAATVTLGCQPASQPSEQLDTEKALMKLATPAPKNIPTSASPVEPPKKGQSGEEKGVSKDSGAGKTAQSPAEAVFQDAAMRDSVNVLINGSFEDNIASDASIPGWQAPAGLSLTLMPLDGREGNVLRINVEENQNVGIAQTVSVKPQDRYRLSGFAKVQDCAGPVRLEVQDADGGYKSFLAPTDSVTGTNQWTHLEKRFTVPAHVSQLKVYLRRIKISDALEGKEVVCFDDVKLEKEIDGNDVTNAGATTETNTAVISGSASNAETN